ncbi:MAG: HlyC/CorC family transporter [Planctomycetales bacterium]|nr:HlyC/CorC family transporter [Planctomycetales bacterium]
MQSAVWIEIGVILLLIVANGFFAGAEIAIIAAGRGQLRKQAQAGDRPAQVALDLLKQPDQFLPTVQVGVTLVSTFASTFSGATLVFYLSDSFDRIPLQILQDYSQEVSLGIVVVGLTFVSVVLGELVPKRLALLNTTGLARLAAVPVQFLSRIGRPVVWTMNVATEAVLFVLGKSGAKAPSVTLDEIQHLIELGTAEGVLEPVEQRLAVGALRLGDRDVRQIMHPRIDIDAVDIETPADEIVGVVAMSGFTRLPVYEGDLDHVIGIVHLKDVLRQHYLGWPINLRKLCHKPLFVPDTKPLDQLLVALQKEHSQMALVVDEFGATKGLVTLDNVVTAMAGDFLAGETPRPVDRIVQRSPSSWLVDGTVPLDELLDTLQLAELELAPPRNVTTVAGLVIAKIGRLPRVGEKTRFDRLQMEVVDLDDQRVDKLLVTLMDRPTTE